VLELAKGGLWRYRWKDLHSKESFKVVWPLILQGATVTVVAFANKRKAGWTSSIYALYGDGVLPKFADAIPLPKQASMMSVTTLMSAILVEEIK